MPDQEPEVVDLRLLKQWPHVVMFGTGGCKLPKNSKILPCLNWRNILAISASIRMMVVNHVTVLT
jgi:hypothetical protein